jgi:hypothetical protein
MACYIGLVVKAARRGLGGCWSGELLGGGNFLSFEDLAVDILCAQIGAVSPSLSVESLFYIF